MSNLVNTNIQWLPYLKTDWKVLRVKNAFYASKEKAHQETPTILSLARSGVKIRDISNNEGQLAESYYDYNPVRPGDLLLNPMDLYSGANCNVSEVEGVISPAYANLRAKVELNPSYFDYYFKTQYWTMAMFAHGKGVSFDNRWTLNNETLMNYELPFPPYEEQTKIVDFLKDKIAKIDKLIQNQEKQIEKLDEFKHAFIYEEFTKRVYGNSCLVDSRVEWLGKIPSNYLVAQMKRVTKFIKCGIASTPDYVSEDEGVLFLSAQNIKNSKIDLSVTRYIPKELHKILTKKQKVEKNDILQVRVGATIGNCAFVEDDLECSVYVSLSHIRFNELVLPKYMFYILQCNDFKNAVFGLIDYAGSVGNLNVDDLKNTYIPIPPLDIQVKIVDSLERKMKKIDELIAIKQEKIEKLQEYKKSLIYEYVTGKKEV